MTRFLSIAIFLASAAAAFADTVVPSRTIRANTIISDRDVKIVAGISADGFERITDVIGQEARVALYAGRPIRVNDIGPPALVARNQIVLLLFSSMGLKISTEGRALERGGVGDLVRIMNLSSRSTLFGQVQSDGSVLVHQ
ncbi:MAG: flagellar basal body P-ring formation chaperone FlgA [Sulfitobacter sp.]